MTRRIIARVGAGVLFVVLAWIGYTQNQTQPGKLTINKIHDDLYEIEGDGGNVAVLVTSEGVILVDDKFEYDHDAILEQIKTITPLPVKYIINTHYHQDHSGGNAEVPPHGRYHLDAERPDQYSGAQAVERERVAGRPRAYCIYG